jgi:hypothetical protein
MLDPSMALTDDLRRIADVAVAFAGPEEELSAVIPTEPAGGSARIYLCAYSSDGHKTWIALDGAGAPVTDRHDLRDAVSIAGMVELAEETAGGGHLQELRAQLETLRATDAPEGIDEAEAALDELERTLADELRVASPAYLDEVGQATRRLEQTLGGTTASPFLEAMKQASLTIDGLAADIETHYKVPLS